MSQLYYNDITTDIASLDTVNKTINYLRRVDDKRLDDAEWQEVLEDVAEKCNTSVSIILACFDLPDDTDFEVYIADETVEYSTENEDEYSCCN